MLELIPVKNPDAILFSDKPLGSGGQISKLTPEEFKAKSGIEYSEGIWLDPSIRLAQLSELPQDIQSDVPADELRTQIHSYVQNPPQNLVICNMGEVGYGVCTTTAISKNTIICLYSGVIKPYALKHNPNDYAHSYCGSNLMVTPVDNRGIATFMQHLPTEPRTATIDELMFLLKITGQSMSKEALKLQDELFSIKFKSNTERLNVATKNVELEYLLYKGIPVIALVALRDIAANEQLGFNYGYKYWLNRKRVPELFYINGSIIPHDAYKRTFGALFFPEFTYTGDLTSLIEKVQQDSDINFDIKGKIYTVTANDVKNELVRVNAIDEFPLNHLEERTPKEPKNIFFETCGTNNPEQALRRAAAMKTVQEIEQLLQDTSIDINAQDENPDKLFTALHLAIINNKIENAESLLKHKARYDILNSKKMSAIDYAIRDKQTQLLNHIAQTIILPLYATDDSNKALRVAADKGDTENLKVLLQVATNINEPGPSTGQTALHRAALKNHTECIKLLMNAGANSAIKDKAEKYPYEYTTSNDILLLLKPKSDPVLSIKSLSNELKKNIITQIGKLDGPAIIKIIEELGADDVKLQDKWVIFSKRFIKNISSLKVKLSNLSQSGRTFEVTEEGEHIKIDIISLRPSYVPYLYKLTEKPQEISQAKSNSFNLRKPRK